MTDAPRPSELFDADATAGVATATMADPGDYARWHVTFIHAAYSDDGQNGELTVDLGNVSVVFEVEGHFGPVALFSPFLGDQSTAVTAALSAGAGGIQGRVVIGGYQA